MKILIFSTAYLPFIGGAELAIKEITDRLSSSEFSFDLITLNLDRKQKPEEQVGSVHVIRLSCPKLFFPIFAFIRARRQHRASPYDRVWSIMASYGGFAGLFFKHHFPKVPFILTLQEGDSLSHIYKRAIFVWPLFKRIFTKADRITAISNYLAEWAKKKGAKCPVEVTPNGVAVGKFESRISNLEKEEIRRKFGISKEDKVIITTSRLVEKNGVGDLIEAMQYLPESVKLLICGDGQLLKNLQLTTSNLQLTGRVSFLGMIPHAELPKYLHISDVFVRASRSEGMGSSFIEAMAAGLPVVATPVGGIPDFLSDPSFTRPDSLRSDLRSEERSDLFPSGHYGQTGLFCRVGNPRDIAEKVQRLLSDNELWNRVVANASKLVREKYKWDGIAEEMCDIFAIL